VPDKRVVAILWFVAAGLAFLAVGIQVSTSQPPRWALAAGGVFCLAMGIGARSRP
jgi:hypothetical protein